MDIGRALKVAVVVLSVEQVVAISAILFFGWQNHQAGEALNQRTAGIDDRIKAARAKLSTPATAADRQAEVAAIDRDFRSIVSERARLRRRDEWRLWLMGLQAFVGIGIAGAAIASNRRLRRDAGRT